MKTKLKHLFSALLFLVAMTAFAEPIAVEADVPAPAIAIVALGAIAVVHLLDRMTNVRHATLMGIDVAIWVDYIIEKFWANNTFLQFAASDDEYVYKGKYVIKPQAGSPPKVEKNRELLPAKVKRRDDTTNQYPLDWYTTDPVVVTNADEYEISYNKMDSLLGQHVAKLNDEVARDMIGKWMKDLPADQIIKTTGGAAEYKLPGITAARKKLRWQELMNAALKMNAYDVPATDRYALLSAFHYKELLESMSASEYKDFSAYADFKKGVVGQLFGINIISRSSVARYAKPSSDYVLKPYGAATETTDFDAAIVWQKDAVSRALGTVNVFEKDKEPTYYGDLLSAEIFAGGHRQRNDNLGVVAIVQDTHSD